MEPVALDAQASAPAPASAKIEVCTQCRRRKQKCDRETPCSNCVRRGVAYLCTSVRQDLPPRPGPIRSFHRSPTTNGQFRSQALEPHLTSTTQRPTVLGRLWNTRGAPTFHDESYFGHQTAADLMQVESPELSMGVSGIPSRETRSGARINAFRSEKAPHAHIWELLGYLPRQKFVVDRLVAGFARELNHVLDGFHEETFMSKYDLFWDRKWSDDDALAIDLRWLSLLFIVLAYGELLDCPHDASKDMQRDCEETSLQFYWAARISMTLSATFWGESPDTVRASILVTRYLIYHGRKTEGWYTSKFAVTFAQAQGMHIDGESWGLPPKVLETRRRLWCTVHALEKGISLAIGRPSATTESTCMQMNIRNLWIDDKSDAEALATQEEPTEHPTRSMFYICQQELSMVIGRIQSGCFGLNALSSSYNGYEKVLDLDRVLLEWANSLPNYFRMQDPDTSMDNTLQYLHWQRLSLHSAFHSARVTLHRTYLLRDSLTNRFQYSHDACVDSACADLALKLTVRTPTVADRLRVGTATYHLCSSALVLGIIAVRDPLSSRTSALLQDLAAYCEKQNSDTWVNEFTLAEVRVIELCISSARKLRQDAGLPDRQASTLGLLPRSAQRSPQMPPLSHPEHAGNHSGVASRSMSDHGVGQRFEGGMATLSDDWLDSWFGPSRMFPDPGDYQSWQDLVGTLEALQ